jgi:type IV secretory pathway ATPase VirB11/archaellum biosynthesis ATPase
MLLKEMFSPPDDNNNEDQNIDWADDLKFHIDNTDELLERSIFPVLDKHKEYMKHPNVWKLYLKPVKKCLRHYSEKYEVKEVEEKFTPDILEAVAKKICSEQEKHIKDGDYEMNKK